MRWDETRDSLVPKYDLSPAAEHGELVYLLGPNASPFSPHTVLPELTRKLDDYTDKDFLLLIGNPCLIGYAVALAADASPSGTVSLLQWSGKDRRYIPVRAQLFDCASD